MKRPLKILLVSAAYRPYPSGVSEHVHNLASALRSLGQEVTILTTRFPKYQKLVPADNTEIPILRYGKAILLPLNRSYATLPVGTKLCKQIATLLHTHQFDIVHCHGFFFPEISYWALIHSNSVNVVTSLTAGFKIHRFGNKLFRMIFAKEIKKIHGKIAISNRARTAIEPYLPGEYRIIPSGVNLKLFHPGYKPKIKKRTGEKIILFLGRLDKRKGLEILIQAMPLIISSIPHIRLVVIGDGPRKKHCVKMVHDLGLAEKVFFLGAVQTEELPEYYCSADVYCSPALGGETLGIVLLEAMACGVPVVASNIPGYDETVSHLNDGVLVTPGNSAELAKAIIKVLSDNSLRANLINAGLHKVKKNYDWSIIASKTLDYYYELMLMRNRS
ncbi:MAG: glycosyltransferase family 4 protein [candidate division WOR-3 bacterium]|uniref:Glycosyltransferase family 1 protein n=1 Tax=candidate division WOR-3 bacterium TaxID=2052148 RepID=A0A7C1SDK1_UNCW3|nr:glycosyltransferase family 4 protein [candidate division WOR-3 bacterium]